MSGPCWLHPLPHAAWRVHEHLSRPQFSPAPAANLMRASLTLRGGFFRCTAVAFSLSVDPLLQSRTSSDKPTRSREGPLCPCLPSPFRKFPPSEPCHSSRLSPYAALRCGALLRLLHRSFSASPATDSEARPPIVELDSACLLFVSIVFPCLAISDSRPFGRDPVR